MMNESRRVSLFMFEIDSRLGAVKRGERRRSIKDLRLHITEQDPPEPTVGPAAYAEQVISNAAPNQLRRGTSWWRFQPSWAETAIYLVCAVALAYAIVGLIEVTRLALDGTVSSFSTGYDAFRGYVRDGSMPPRLFGRRDYGLVGVSLAAAGLYGVLVASWARWHQSAKLRLIVDTLSIIVLLALCYYSARRLA